MTVTQKAERSITTTKNNSQGWSRVLKIATRSLRVCMCNISFSKPHITICAHGSVCHVHWAGCEAENEVDTHRSTAVDAGQRIHVVYRRRPRAYGTTASGSNCRNATACVMSNLPPNCNVSCYDRIMPLKELYRCVKLRSSKAFTCNNANATPFSSY
jgi:hypothetical protein